MQVNRGREAGAVSKARSDTFTGTVLAGPGTLSRGACGFCASTSWG